MRARIWLLLAGALLGAACGGTEPEGSAPPPASTEARPAIAVPAAPAGTPKVVLLGDSLTAGLGLPTDESYPAVLQRRLARDGYPHVIVNAGVSGDTSAGGLRRMDWSIDADAAILIVALGGNDGLRGLAPAQLKANLAAIIEDGQRRGLTVILAGMEAPPNFGADYTTAFRQVYRDLAREYDVRLIPFLLDRVGGVAELNQPDGIHPNAEGAVILAETVWRALEPVLEESKSTP
ncbi:MAG: arylesterase [Vicinamibacterales bacterium]|nr:arylesterase [Vicinamibacterales bacterium]